MADYQGHTAGPDHTRVFVSLPGSGAKILVPVPQHATVQDVQQRALQRAEKFGVTGTVDSTVLETTGGPPICLSGEDALYDILDLTEGNTFCLRAIDSAPAKHDTASLTVLSAAPPSGPASHPLSISGSVDKDGDRYIYVRWITLDDAVQYSRLRDITVAKSPVPCDTTLAEFYRIAKALLPHPRPQDRLNIYLKECFLNAENNISTFDDLGIKGGHARPLDIFVEFTCKEDPGNLSQLIKSSDPSDIWSFSSGKRGICTLVASLQILLSEIGRGNCTVSKISKALLAVTHFPPVVLAFNDIWDTRLEESTPLRPLLLIASAFQAICGKMVPSWRCAHPDALLEASRQVVAWLASVDIGPEDEAPLVQHVRIKAGSEDEVLKTWRMTKYCHVQDLPLWPDAGPSMSHTKVSVGLDEDNPDLSRLLGLALLDGYSSLGNYYLNKPLGPPWEECLDHSILPTPHPDDFDRLLHTVNSRGALRMIGPLQLGKCLAAEIPLITLSPTGYVSMYDQEDYECGQRRFYLWNAIEGKINLPNLDPGQFLSQKLEPIIAERRKESSWELDAWAEWNDVADFGPPEEAVVICVDTSTSMDVEMPEGWLPTSSNGVRPSRLTEVKEFFKNYALRISALNLSTYLGLVTFSEASLIKVQQELTPVHINFHEKLETITARGQTAIYNALSRASMMLYELKKLHPKTKCRIVLLTDGEDNRSSVVPANIARSLYDNDIVTDSVVLDFSGQSAALMKIARMTGGYAFTPKTQQALFQIFLLETMVDIRTRPDIVKVPLDSRGWLQYTPKAPDMANPLEFPPCRPHPNLADYFIALSDSERFLKYLSNKQSPVLDSSTLDSRSIQSAVSFGTPRTSASPATSFNNTRTLMSEIRSMIENPHDFLDVYVSESNMGFWKVVLQGPPESPYQNGVFLLYVEIGPEFPRKPPTARFVTPVLHPNITKHGRICHPIFDREWTPQTRIYQVLQHLYGILMSLEARDAIDPLTALKFWTDPDEGEREVQNYIRHFASRSRADLRAEIVGDDVSTIASGTISPAPPSYHSRVFGTRSNKRTKRTMAAVPPSDNASQTTTSSPPSYRSTPVEGRPQEAVQSLTPNSRRRASFFGKILNLKN